MSYHITRLDVCKLISFPCVVCMSSQHRPAPHFPCVVYVLTTQTRPPLPLCCVPHNTDPPPTSLVLCMSSQHRPAPHFPCVVYVLTTQTRPPLPLCCVCPHNTDPPPTSLVLCMSSQHRPAPHFPSATHNTEIQLIMCVYVQLYNRLVFYLPVLWACMLYANTTTPTALKTQEMLWF